MTLPFEPSKSFELGQAIGGNVAGGFQQAGDTMAIDQILQQAQQSGDQGGAMQQILSRVSPQNREGVVKALQASQQQEAAKRMGLDPGAPLSLQLQQLKQKGLGEQPLTPFQQVSTDLRKKEMVRKTETAVTNELMKIADPVFGSIDREEVPAITNNVMSLIFDKGVNPSEAVDKALSNYRSQKDAIEELSIDKFNTKRSEERIAKATELLKNKGVTEPNLIHNLLRGKGYTLEARNKIIKALKLGKGKTKFNARNPDHVKRKEEALRKAAGNRQQATQFLLEEFEV